MLDLFDFHNYREYLNAWIENQGARSYGLKGRMAKNLGVSSSLFSQILKGEKSLTPDQASDLTDYLGMSDLEGEYFHLLVDEDRAANPRYRQKLKKRMEHLQTQSRKFARRVPGKKQLTDEQKAIYYSSWLYTGVRTLTTLPEYGHAEAIAQRLHVEPAVVHRILRFLLDNHLCREDGGRVVHNSMSTHVDNDSPFVNKHHQNWRLQGIQQMERRRESDAFYTAPMALSKEAYAEIRKLIPQVVQNILKITGPSECETTACLNLDWFEY